jgi:DNA recombination protein Rad52
MADWSKIGADLSKQLNPKNIQPPAPGKHGDYLQGWFVISEANRIFGHGGWSYRVTSLSATNAAWDTDRKGKPQFKAGYLAIVCVTVDGVTREDVGHGQGHMPTEGDAHDSAMKEAVTDALKRALRSFGWPFGLALYDKSGAHIADPEELARAERAQQAADKIVAGIRDAESDMAAFEFWQQQKSGPALARLRDSYSDLYQQCIAALDARMPHPTNQEDAA